MASKDNKTSKTARVMNLLSKKPENAPAGETAEAASAPVPPILSSLAPDAAVSVQIKNALEDALESEQEPQSASAPLAQSEPAQQAQPEPAPQQEEPAAPEAEPEPQAEEPAPEPAPKWNVPQQSAAPGYINVMQVLVEERAPKYIQMFGLCQCERCQEDVKALTLNNLPPKYVVLEQGDMIPRLTVYEGKYSSDITAQLLQSCKVVMQTPHHGR